MINRKVNYEFQGLDQLMHEVNTSHLPLTDDRHQVLTKSLEHEVFEIKQRFIHNAVALTDELHLQRYIHQHQQIIIRRMDELLHNFHDQQQLPPAQQLYFNALHQLLLFIEQYFNTYFDQSATAPHAYRTITIHAMEGQVSDLQVQLQTHHADPELTGCILHAPSRIVQSKPSDSISYHDIQYAKEILHRINQLLQPNLEGEALNESLRDLICTFNYNSIRAFNYHSHYIQQLLSTDETRADKLQTLSLMLKKVNQVQPRIGRAYNHQAPSFITQLSMYLIAEMDYLERLQQLAGNVKSTPDDAALFSFKLILEMSVAQLSFLIKVLTETKVIRNPNVSALLRFFSRFIITKRSENISYDSLRAKYYNVEDSARLSVRNLLAAMVAFIDRNK